MTIADPQATRGQGHGRRRALRRAPAASRSKPDYWDHATLLELAVIEGDWDAAGKALADALAALDEPWKAA